MPSNKAMMKASAQASALDTMNGIPTVVVLPRTTIEYDTKITLLSPLHHGGDRRGNTTLFHRARVVSPDGKRVDELPALSGNSVLGQMRDWYYWRTLQKLGYGVRWNDALATYEAEGLALKAYHALLSGGALGEGARGIDIELARRFESLLPGYTLFPFAYGNQMDRSRLRISGPKFLAPEYAHLLPAASEAALAVDMPVIPNDNSSGAVMPPSDTALVEHARVAMRNREDWQALATERVSIFDATYIERHTRMDDSKNSVFTPYLDAGELRQIDAGRLAKQHSEAESGPSDDGETGTKQQMMFDSELIAAGMQMLATFQLTDVTAIQHMAFFDALDSFCRMARLGGGGRRGWGEFKLEIIGLPRTALGEMVTSAELREFAAQAKADYDQHFVEHGAAIRQMLEDL